jgi:hypothetical protein
MSTSKTIAALLGPTLIATAAMVLVNLDAMPTLIEGMAQSPMLVVLAGYAAFVPGLAVVYFHNHWTGGWPVVVTVMGWLSLIIGLIRMIFPMQIATMASKLAPAPSGMLIGIGVVFLLIGGFLSFKAYVRD